MAFLFILYLVDFAAVLRTSEYSYIHIVSSFVKKSSEKTGRGVEQPPPPFLRVCFSLT